jgi:hypothetical protein
MSSLQTFDAANQFITASRNRTGQPVMPCGRVVKALGPVPQPDENLALLQSGLGLFAEPYAMRWSAEKPH